MPISRHYVFIILDFRIPFLSNSIVDKAKFIIKSIGSNDPRFACQKWAFVPHKRGLSEATSMSLKRCNAKETNWHKVF
jgi:hypothetical protein